MGLVAAVPAHQKFFSGDEEMDCLLHPGALLWGGGEESRGLEPGKRAVWCW